jgi:cell wall-associated NlpC family hydrolase
VHTRPAVKALVGRRGVGTAVGVLAVGLVVGVCGVAAASPQPTIAQVQQRLTQLNTQSDRVGQQYDQAQQELVSANQRLALVNREASRYEARFQSTRESIAQIAATAYEEGNLTSPAALLTAGNPQQILNQSSILLELSANNSAAMNQFLAAARQLTGAQQAARRIEAGTLALKNSLKSRQQSLNKLRAQEETLLAQLTPAQQAVATPGGTTGNPGTGTTPSPSPSPSPSPGSGSTQYKGSTSTQAGKAVAFAYAQIGKPYQWGATGPYSFDCSGLTQAAWANAGVSIPRISYDQMSQLPAVSTSALQPGDILGFAGNSHVGIYVGGGYLIDAPQTGSDVEKVALAGWYQSELDGAVRP